MSPRKWVVKVNGRKSLNGARYCVVFDGDLSVAAPCNTLYDQAAVLAMAIQGQNREMEFPDSIQITIP
jgi:hypothetical protein